MAGYASFGSLNLPSNIGLNMPINTTGVTPTQNAGYKQTQIIPQSPTSKNVLGTTTTSGGGNTSGGGGANGYQSSAPGPGQNGYVNPNSVQGGGAQLPSLDSLYQPIFDSYNATRGQIQGYQTQDTADLTNSYNQNKGLIPGYEQSARGTLAQNTTALNNQVQSAYDQAARNFDWAKGSAQNAYGYNGAYLGANSMAQSELARELGQVGQQGVAGQQQLNTEGQDITNWVNTQNATLDQQFASAKDNLNQYFQSQLFAIQQDENATTAQKAAGKQQLLEDVMNQNNAIALQAQNFKQQLALYTSQLGQTGGQNIDLSSFLAKMGGIGGNINSQVNPGNQSYSVLTGNNANSGPSWTGASQGQNNDYLNQILQGTGTSANVKA